MKYLDYLVDQMLVKAVGEIEDRGFSRQIVTLALYFDHEGSVLSVCADTLDSSNAKEESARIGSYRHLSDAINAGDLAKAALFNHSIGRSLSLGDFALIRLAQHALEPDDGAHELPQSFFVSLAQGLHRNTAVCMSVCDPKHPFALACSTANDELGLFWTPPATDG